MPSIKPKNATEWGLLALTGTKGLNARMAVSANDRADAYADRDAERAERERERHQVEIERVKRRQAEEENERLLAAQEDAARDEATRISFGQLRGQFEAASKARGQAGPQLTPEEADAMARLERLLPDLSPDAQRAALEDTTSYLESKKIEAAKAESSNLLANTIKDLLSSDVDVGPLVDELRAAGQTLQLAETFPQVAQAVQLIKQTSTQARQAVVAEHVKADKRAAAIQSINELYGGDPARAGQASALTRAVQFGVMEPDKALEMAVKEKYGIKPPSAEEFAAKGGTTTTLFSTPQGRMAAAHMTTKARDRVYARMKAELGPEATTEQRTEFLQRETPREQTLVFVENGWFPPADQMGAPGPDNPAKNRSWSTAESKFGDATNTEIPGAARPPKVPLEKVQEAMGNQPAQQDDPAKTREAIAQEVLKRVKARGGTKADYERELKAALKDMNL